jgi:hypothetical protein
MEYETYRGLDRLQEEDRHRAEEGHKRQVAGKLLGEEEDGTFEEVVGGSLEEGSHLAEDNQDGVHHNLGEGSHPGEDNHLEEDNSSMQEVNYKTRRHKKIDLIESWIAFKRKTKGG